MRVRERVAEWAQLGASAELLGCIKHGVKLVFNKETRRKLARNTKLSFDQGRSLDKLAPDEREFLEAEMTRLLKIGAWEECPESAVCCISRVFLVPKKGSKKYRLVIDLRELNATQAPATCEAVDALSLPDSAWRQETNYCNPPWSLLLKLALKLEQSGAAATVLTPDWPRATWFPLLTELADTVMRFRAKPGLFVPGRSHAQRRTMPPPRWDVLAFCIPSRPPRKPLATAGDFFLPT